MYLTLHLLAAHFIADYPLQSNKLIKYKRKRILGVVLHSLIHLVISCLLVLPFFSYKVFWGIVVIFIAHVIIDETKGLLCKYTKINGFLLYIVDQIVHVVTVYLVAVYFIGKTAILSSGSWVSLYTNQSIISFILILVLVTYFYDVSKWTFFNHKNPHPYKRDYKGMIRNAVIVIIAFGVYWITY